MLSNTAVPRYYGEFRDKVISAEIPVNHEIALEMSRIDDLIDNPAFIMTMKLSRAGYGSAKTNSH